MAAPTQSVCFICEKAPCECASSKKSRRRTARRPAAQPVPPSPQQAQPKKRVAKKSILGGSSSKEAKVESSEDAADVIEAGDGMSADESAHLYAARLLAHMLGARPMDQLEEFKDDILPTDLLPPEERIESWKRRLRGGHE